jgi:hypothetical protein
MPTRQLRAAQVVRPERVWNYCCGQLIGLSKVRRSLRDPFIGRSDGVQHSLAFGICEELRRPQGFVGE